MQVVSDKWFPLRSVADDAREHHRAGPLARAAGGDLLIN